jgi:Holliday junction resolvase
MTFDIKISPPTSTAQMKKVRIVNGRPMFYEPAKVKAAKQLLISALRLYKPDEPFTGAVQLTVILALSERQIITKPVIGVPLVRIPTICRRCSRTV